jgi:hypothetical protein
MQTPQGFEMVDGQAHARDWLAVIFNPSLPYRFTHMLIASGLTARSSSRACPHTAGCAATVRRTCCRRCASACTRPRC